MTFVVAAQVTTQWKLYGVGIAVLTLLLIYLVVSLAEGDWNPWKLVEGADGTASTSKLQWFVWLIVIVFAYVALWVIRAREGDYSAITTVPANLLAVLGFSTVTAVGAKGITVGYKNTGKITKASKAESDALENTASNPGSSENEEKGGIFSDDDGIPELAKIQMIAFTVVAVGIFLANVVHQMQGSSPPAELPNIDSSLLVLMGISQGGYLGKKLVTLTTPFLNVLTPTTAKVGDTVTLTGTSFGTGAGASRLLLDGNPIKTTGWRNTEITFAVPDEYPHAGVRWDFPQVVRIGVDLGGGTSGNDLMLTVTEK